MLGLSWLGLFGLSDRARLPPPAIRVIGWDLLVGRYSSRQRATANTKTRGPPPGFEADDGPQCLCVSEYAVVYRCLAASGSVAARKHCSVSSSNLSSTCSNEERTLANALQVAIRFFFMSVLMSVSISVSMHAPRSCFRM